MLSALNSYFFPSESVKCECCGKTTELYTDECSGKCSCGAILLIQTEPGMRYVKHNCIEGARYFMVKESLVLLRCYSRRCSALYIIEDRVCENICGQNVHLAQPILEKLHFLENQKEKLKKEVLSLSAEKVSSQAMERELKEKIRILNEDQKKKIEELEGLTKTMKKEMAARQIAMVGDMDSLHEVTVGLMETLEKREEELKAMRQMNKGTTGSKDEGLVENSAMNQVYSPTGDFAECDICHTKVHFNPGKWFTHCQTPTCDGNLLLAELSKKYRYVTASCDPTDIFYCDASMNSFCCPCFKEHIIDTDNPKIMDGQKVFLSKLAVEVVEENKKTIEKKERDYESLRKNFALMVKINTSLLEKVRKLEENQKNE